MMKNDRIWISWEFQRRTIELSKKFNCDLYIFEENGYFRYLKCIKKTFFLIKKEKPLILFVQNPSMILAALTGLLKPFFGYCLIVDRHSSFRVGKKYKNKIDTNYFYNKIFYFLDRFTINSANLTIVTNGYLEVVVNYLGGNGAVLPDRLPEIPFVEKKNLGKIFNILLISSCHKDEPFLEIFKAMEKLISYDIKMYITGNYKKLSNSIMDVCPTNVIFTGFVPEKEYFSLLKSVDIIMVLTTSDYTMLCGCYEAVSAEKPLITSNNKVLKDYFQGAYFVNNDNLSIYSGILNVKDNLSFHESNIKKLKFNLEKEWPGQFENVLKMIEAKE